MKPAATSWWVGASREQIAERMAERTRQTNAATPAYGNRERDVV